MCVCICASAGEGRETVSERESARERERERENLLGTILINGGVHGGAREFIFILFALLFASNTKQVSRLDQKQNFHFNLIFFAAVCNRNQSFHFQDRESFKISSGPF